MREAAARYSLGRHFQLGSTGAAMPRFIFLTGIIILLIADRGVAAAGTNTDATRALETAPSWCVIQHDSSDQPECYEYLISCVMAALVDASSCTQQPSSGPPNQDAANQRTFRVVHSRGHRAHASLRHHKLTADERDELFRKFQQWRSTHE
jgi:hypothetical protein